MKQTFKLFGALALCLPFALCGCTTKDGEANEKVTKVKILEVNNSLGDGVQTYSGTIEESDGTSLSFAGGGTVTRVAVNAGQSVKRGQLIATVDSRNAANSASASRASIEQADDLVQQAKASLKQAQDAYNRMKILHDNGSLQEIKWIEVETKLEQAKLMVSQAQSNAKAARATDAIAQKSVGDTRLLAPMSGYISEKLSSILNILCLIG